MLIKNILRLGIQLQPFQINQIKKMMKMMKLLMTLKTSYLKVLMMLDIENVFELLSSNNYKNGIEVSEIKLKFFLSI
jgi:hypothetical protein